MKRLFTLSIVIFAVPLFVFSQAKDYRVVFDLTSKDTMDQRAVVRWINEIASYNPNAQMEVVLYSQSLDMVTKGKSAFEEAVARFTASKTASFKVCAIAMKNHNIDKSQLIPGVEIVQDGIYEIVQKQNQGWGYIKASR